MEGDLALRLGQRHQIVEFSNFVGHDFYHLEHYSNMTEYKDRNGTATPRKKNTPKFEGLSYVENDKNWGLFDFDLPLRTNSAKAKNFDFYEILKVPQLIMGIILLGIDKTSEIIVVTLPKLRIWFGKLISHQ